MKNVSLGPRLSADNLAVAGIRKLLCCRLTLCDSKRWQNVKLEIQPSSIVLTSSENLNSVRKEKPNLLPSCLCVSCDLFLRMARLLSRNYRCVPPEKPSWSCTGRAQHLKWPEFNAKPLERFRPCIFVFHAWRTPSDLQISGAEMFCLRNFWKNWLVIQFKRTNLQCVKSQATFSHCNFKLVEFLTFYSNK